MELAVTGAARAAVDDEKNGYVITSDSECRDDENGSFARYTERIKNFRKKCENFKNLRVFEGGEGYDIDITRIVIYQKYISGLQLEKMLAEENIVVEMSGLDYVVLISSYVDNEADFVDLYAALQKIDGKISEKLGEITTGECGNIQATLNASNHNLKAGDISPADFYVYPPGIPIIAKGELITEEALSELRELGNAGKKIHMS
jgi:arginine/lysine/ornithine decarboxylase